MPSLWSAPPCEYVWSVCILGTQSWALSHKLTLGLCVTFWLWGFIIAFGIFQRLSLVGKCSGFIGPFGHPSLCMFGIVCCPVTAPTYFRHSFWLCQYCLLMNCYQCWYLSNINPCKSQVMQLPRLHPFYKWIHQSQQFWLRVRKVDLGRWGIWIWLPIILMWCASFPHHCFLSITTDFCLQLIFLWLVCRFFFSFQSQECSLILARWI